MTSGCLLDMYDVYTQTSNQGCFVHDIGARRRTTELPAGVCVSEKSEQLLEPGRGAGQIT